MNPSSKLRGASTITQQVAKSVLATYESYEKATERTLERKIREAILARNIEGVLTKDEILFIYMNEIFWDTKPTVSRLRPSTISGRTFGNFPWQRWRPLRAYHNGRVITRRISRQKRLSPDVNMFFDA